MTEELIKAFKPDLVVWSTGSKPLLPPIEGLREQVNAAHGRVHDISYFLDHLEEEGRMSGKRIGIAGGGAVALDVAEFFAENGNQVFLVEQFPAVGRDLDLFSKVYMGDVLAKHQAEVYTSHRLVEVRPDSFVVSGEQGAKVLEFDCAYICLGLQSNTPPAAMQQDLQQSGIACSTIGDSRRARRIYEGIHEGRSVVDTLKALGFYE